MARILYLGIDAPSGVFHYPVIRTERIDSPELQKAFSLWSRCTHVIFTSKNGVRHWPFDMSGKITVAIGEATASEIRLRGSCPLVASDPTQEGVVALLDLLDLNGALVLYPRSKRARPDLADYLKFKNIDHYTLDLYETVFQQPQPAPNLSDFDEIVFTSPSTVEAFLRIFPSVPCRIALTPIGPITKMALAKIVQSRDNAILHQEAFNDGDPGKTQLSDSRSCL